MPLHLLGKKSWNVYNADNIARVQRDEAEARAQEEAEEQRMQEYDAKRRLAILRGETPPALPEEQEDGEKKSPRRPKHNWESTLSGAAGGRGRKRKRAGEDDTDFEMRLARERAEIGERATRELASDDRDHKRKSSSKGVSLVDNTGHISLFEPASDPSNRRKEKNEEFEREAARKKREEEDNYRMRFVNAAGKDGLGLTTGRPWYAAPDEDSTSALVAPSKNVFGRDDPGRKAREAARLDSSDPLAMMKVGAAKVRQLDKERRKVNEEREEELRALKKEEHKREKRRLDKEDQADLGRNKSKDAKREVDSSSRDRHSRSGRDGHSRRRDRDRRTSKERRRDEERRKRLHRPNDAAQRSKFRHIGRDGESFRD